MPVRASPEKHQPLWPSRLKAGDKVRFISPASTPDREAVFRRARILESWGLEVDFGEHAFARNAYLAGTDEERLADFNAALRDSRVRAIFATRGGKGSYRIADQADFEAARKDPKFIIGFSDITILHLSLWKHCRLVGIHGALMEDGNGNIPAESSASLKGAMMGSDDLVVRSRMDENTATLTTGGTARGVLIGGNLDMISTGAGWALPVLKDAILLLEAVNMYVGQVDRQLTMLRKAGHLDGLAGIAVGQFTDFKPSAGLTIVELLRQHLWPLNVPILGGLPLGHGTAPLSIAVGAMADLDTASGTLHISNPST